MRRRLGHNNKGYNVNFPASLVRLYRFNQTGCIDVVGGNNGIAQAGAPSVDNTRAIEGNSYLYTADHYFIVNSFSFNDGTNNLPFAWAGWFYLTQSGRVDALIGSNVFNASAHVYVESGDLFVFHMNKSGKTVQKAPVTRNSWNHFIAEYDGNTTKSLTINGATASETVNSNPVLNGSDPLYFGKNWGYGLRGNIDQFAFWNRTLTAEEKAALYNDGEGIYL